jgi:hypothetical protein
MTENAQSVLRRALAFIEHNAVVPQAGHICGDPNVPCDSVCAEAAEDARLMHDLRRLIGQLRLAGTSTSRRTNSGT